MLILLKLITLKFRETDNFAVVLIFQTMYLPTLLHLCTKQERCGWVSLPNRKIVFVSFTYFSFL